ncbi:helix-turn-helix domain-containing protein [Sphingomonas sp.]|uniref:helix-turn-helix domain-containing protein n=1 Tax=Sphingomonas sp. TaxID=28214 RepID=UPI003D6C89F6
MEDQRADRALIERHAGQAGSVRANPAGSVMMVRAGYDAFAGEVRTGPYLRIGMALGPATRLFQNADGVRLDGQWRFGEVVVTPPHRRVETRSAALRMVGLAIDLDRATKCQGCAVLDADLARAAGGFQRDRLLTSVLSALWHEADVHGASSAFFDHGVALVLQRLADLPPPPGNRRVYPLGPERFARVVELIESRLDDDLSVPEMAAEAGQDPSGFTRSFRATTGMTPYAFLTLRRMERAKLLLATGLSVTRVAGAVGYANAGKFASAFVRMCGVTPSAWQRGR